MAVITELRQRVTAAFDSAEDYDHYASVQRRVAASLADRIMSLGLAGDARILEIGCGTGFLGAGLIDRLPGARWLMTDLSPAMVERARERFRGRPNIELAVMDGGDPDVDGPFDLICSSLAMQWLPDLEYAVEQLRALLAPSGQLVFATLADGSFAEWRDAHLELDPGTPAYPSASRLATLGLTVSVNIFSERKSAREFLADLKAIGASVPRHGHRPLRPRQLREVMARFEESGGKISYVVATCRAGR